MRVSPAPRIAAEEDQKVAMKISDGPQMRSNVGASRAITGSLVTIATSGSGASRNTRPTLPMMAIQIYQHSLVAVLTR